MSDVWGIPHKDWMRGPRREGEIKRKDKFMELIGSRRET